MAFVSSARTSALSLALWIFVIMPLVFAKPPKPADPFIDPKADPWNPLKYIPSNTLTTIALTLYLVASVDLFYSIWKWGAKYMLCMAIGGITYSIGLGFRYGLHNNPDSTGIYILEYLFVVLSPCAFIAAVYIVLGQLSGSLHAGRYLLISPQKVTRIFVSSDITTFLIQAAGGSISTSTVPKTQKSGNRIFLIGLILQLISFVFFTIMALVWSFKVRTHDPEIWLRDQRAGKPRYRDWRALLAALFISCVGILIRSIFRVAEASQGYGGHLATTEPFFYCLDSLPLLIAIGIYIPFWPGRYIDQSAIGQKQDVETAQVRKSLHEMGPLPAERGPASDPSPAATFDTGRTL